MMTCAYSLCPYMVGSSTHHMDMFDSLTQPSYTRVACAIDHMKQHTLTKYILYMLDVKFNFFENMI